MMNISEQQLRKWVEEEIEDPAVFVVDIEIKGEKSGREKILIHLDGDKGLNIQQCAGISRKLGAKLEESDLLGDNLILEVSSFGVGRPLQLLRQYVNNIGRKLKIEMKDGKNHEGQLKEVSDSEIVIQKKFKKEVQLITIEMSEIKSTQVLVSFN